MAKRRDSEPAPRSEFRLLYEARLSLLLSASVSFTCTMRTHSTAPWGLGSIKEVMCVQRLEQPWPSSGAGHAHCHYRLPCFLHFHVTFILLDSSCLV